MTIGATVGGPGEGTCGCAAGAGADQRVRTEAAWQRRETILSASRRPPLARRLPELIAERTREACTVREAVRALELGVLF